jgi:hypothetical protein
MDTRQARMVRRMARLSLVVERTRIEASDLNVTFGEEDEEFRDQPHACAAILALDARDAGLPELQELAENTGVHDHDRLMLIAEAVLRFQMVGDGKPTPDTVRGALLAWSALLQDFLGEETGDEVYLILDAEDYLD